MTRKMALIRWFLSSAALAMTAFLCAGRTDLPMLRVYLGVFAAVTLVAALVVDPELLEERSNPGQTGLDLFCGRGITFLFLSTIAIAALDTGRFHWTQSVTFPTEAAALTLVVALTSLQTWAMSVNPFFSSVIRLQTDRGHRLITHGPYRFIRHPGYFAMFFNMPATAVALGSWIALIPALLCSAMILRRTIREDHFLKDKLPRYPGYMIMVRYRLFPGLW